MQIAQGKIIKIRQPRTLQSLGQSQEALLERAIRVWRRRSHCVASTAVEQRKTRQLRGRDVRQKARMTMKLRDGAGARHRAGGQSDEG